ncbi:protein mesh [Patella vulgata]|uniref:protein mesh n=1 Tax=Patella vulgata TaxID=6465 RepID=UPI00217F74BD|nr:protein mesh [Patella vulgata]
MITNVVGVKLFTADTALVVTWVDVTDVISAADGCQGNACTQTNTFQLVIVAGKSQTFTIFNYGKMDSTGHTYYQAGMNGGYNIGWTDVYCDDDCSSTKLNQLPNLQGSDTVGRFIYKVSEQVIIRGGCLPPNSPSGKLEFYPQFANMYGGEIIEISGYCTQPDVQATCKFGFAEETQAMIFPNSPKIHCEVPKLTERGVVNLVVTQGQSQTLTGHFHIVLFGRSNHHVYPINPQNPERVVWNETNPEELSLKWDIAGLNDAGGSATVDINLIGYREDENGFYWELLDVLGKDVLNAEGQYTFKTADHQCKGDQCWMYEMGVVEVRLPRQYWTASTKNSSYTYGVVPLGWFVRDYMEQTYGADWNSQKCQKWYEKDKLNMAWQEELLACPCNLNQAITDFGRWQPDVGCNMHTGSACHYHIGAIHCVRSVNPTASGAGNQCCYNEDGSLKYAADSYQGSTPDRAHDWGAPPFNKPGYVPSLSHWIHDVISFYHCCLWVEYQQCDLYMEQRATRDCKNYSPPKTAFIYGDPHITTFDLVSYDFYGRGEYWLLKHDQMSIQGRFEDTHLSYTPLLPINITVLSGVVMKAPGSCVVEIRFNSPVGSSGPVLNVIVNNKTRVFGGSEPEWQDYIGVSVVQNSVGYNSNPQSNFTIMFQSGVGVLVAAVNQLLHLTVVIPPEFKGSTSGLLYVLFISLGVDQWFIGYLG